MRDNWYNYPLSVFLSAISSTFVAILLLIAVINAGSMLANIAATGDFDGGFFLLTGGFFHIALACMQLWGFGYLVVVIIVAHRVLYEEASSLKAMYMLFVLQYILALLVLAGLDESRFQYAAPSYRSIAILLALLLFPTINFFRKIKRIRLGEQHPGTDAETTPRGSA
jgi:hypothetical protein